MAHAAILEPALEALSNGRVFRKRPSPNVVEAFIRHLAQTGAPHRWPGISTTAPDRSSTPVLLKRFSIPDRFRKGPNSRAPCPICSPIYPKFESGYLVWHPDEGLVRAIGHECGSEHFVDGAFDAAVDIYEIEQEEAAARAYLKIEFRQLPRNAMFARFIRDDLKEQVRVRDEFVATVTKKAIDRLLRVHGPDGTLKIEGDSGRKDAAGRGLIGSVIVAKIAGGSALKCGQAELATLRLTAETIGADLIVVLDEQDDFLRGLTATDAIKLERAVRSFNKALTAATEVHGQLSALLTAENLIELGRWGSHSDCPNPFWVAAVADKVFAGKGIKPQRFSGLTPLRLVGRPSC